MTAMSASSGRVLIVGAGIGGLSAAIALQRAGIEATVYERASDLRRVQLGGGLHMWPNAMRALAQLGVTEQVWASGTPLERTEYRTWRGKLLGAWPVGEVGRALGYPDVGLSRADLHQGVLAGAVDAGALRLGKECTGFSQDGEGVTVRFADGSEERGELLIGADGIRSAIRAQLLGPAPPRYAGYTQWQAITDFRHQSITPGLERVYFGPGLRVVVHHVGGERLFWAGVTYNPETGRQGGDERKAMLLRRFGTWHAPIPEMLAATDEDAITWMDVYDRPPVARWGEGRVTLLGDAAHPMTTNLSQGGCLAIEDAAVLANCLGREGPVPAALRRYEARRIPRTRTFATRSHRIAMIGGAKNPLLCLARDFVFGRIFDGPALRQHRQDMAYAL
jgi:2-polyprenyl-6-methoxyphenol hydroxylase-like FAD-dependent oxidoreductase